VGQFVVVIGTQWGDEGKGKVVDLLTERAAAVARFQGGHNAGHTLVIGGRKTILSLIPAEILREHVRLTLIVEQIAKVEGIVATPADVQDELEALSRQYGQPVARIRKALGNSLLSLMDGIIRNKTLDFLIDNTEGASRAGTGGEETAPSAS